MTSEEIKQEVKKEIAEAMVNNLLQGLVRLSSGKVKQ